MDMPCLAIMEEVQNRPKALRVGQALYNAVSKVSPQVALALHGTEYDCFWDDTKADAFFQKCCQIWRIAEATDKVITMRIEKSDGTKVGSVDLREPQGIRGDEYFHLFSVACAVRGFSYRYHTLGAIVVS